MSENQEIDPEAEVPVQVPAPESVLEPVPETAEPAPETQTAQTQTSETAQAPETSETAQAPETSETAQTSEPEPATEPVPHAESGEADPLGALDPPPFAPPAQPKQRRHIKSRTLFVSAVVVGVLGGLGAGYAVQSSRPPTPLPALLPKAPTYGPQGIYAGIAPSPLPSSQDDLTVTDGDLTALLLPTPAGAKINGASDHDWMAVVDDAALCDGSEQQKCYSDEIEDGLVAIADTGWTTSSGYYEEIRIKRYKPTYNTGIFINGIGYGDNIISTPADLNAAAYSYYDTQEGHVDYGAATHGDLVVEFWVSSDKHAPDPSLLTSLMTQQMARL